MFTRKSKTAAIDTLVGRQSRVDGDVRFAGGFHVDGYVKGNVHSVGESVAIVKISERGVIEGSVTAPEVILNGTIKGNVTARDRIILGPDALVVGDVYYNLIEMSIGAEVHGKLVHQPANSKPLLVHQEKKPG